MAVKAKQIDIDLEHLEPSAELVFILKSGAKIEFPTVFTVGAFVKQWKDNDKQMYILSTNSKIIYINKNEVAYFSVTPYKQSNTATEVYREYI